MSCLFCKIANKTAAAEIVYEDEKIIAFKDIHPKAPLHLLIVPKKHIPRLSLFEDEDVPLLGKMIVLARDIAKQNNFGDRGFRIALNEGKDGGQTIFHVHMHLLYGRRLMWPPG